MMTRTSGSMKKLWVTLRDAALPDDVIDFWCEEFGLLHRQHQFMARITRRQQESADAVSLWLRPANRFPGFRAGQHVSVSVMINGRKITRSYSPSSADLAQGLFRITIRLQENGLLSTHLCHNARVGDLIEVSPGFGEFSLPDSAGPLLLLAAGSGITPLAALFLKASQATRRAETQLFHWDTATNRHLLAEELETTSAQAQHLRYRRKVTTGPSAERLDNGFQNQLPGDLASWTVFACGPRRFVDAAAALCEGTAGRFVMETFDPPAPRPVTGKITVSLARQGRKVSLPTGISILEGLESLGENPAHGCRSGICHTCTCQKVAGQTRDLITGEVHRESGLIQICRMQPENGLVLDL